MAPEIDDVPGRRNHINMGNSHSPIPLLPIRRSSKTAKVSTAKGSSTQPSRSTDDPAAYSVYPPAQAPAACHRPHYATPSHTTDHSPSYSHSYSHSSSYHDTSTSMSSGDTSGGCSGGHH